jgi:uncharacterized protein
MRRKESRMRTLDQVAGMPCPVCRVPLTMSDRQGIEIDYCPQCRGVWLDRGELDKIIERNATPAPTVSVQPVSQQQYQQPYRDDSDHRKYGHKRKKHWLEEIFD